MSSIRILLSSYRKFPTKSRKKCWIATKYLVATSGRLTLSHLVDNCNNIFNAIAI